MKPLARVGIVGAAAALWLIGSLGSVVAWDSYGHRLITRAAALRLPAEVPAFLRAPEAISEMEMLGPEPDRWRGTGSGADVDQNPAHYIDVGDDGTVAGVVRLGALPPNREAYDTALRRAHTDEYRMGYLPYAMIDGWYRIRRDFALWRVEVVGAKKAASAEDRAWFDAHRALREKLTLRDIGVWSHYVGDASQPLHTTIHYNGWGDHPNPHGYSVDKTLHHRFEGDFVRAQVRLGDVLAAMAPYASCDCPVERRVAEGLEASYRLVIPLYELEKADAFTRGTPEARRFVIARLGAGAASLRDLVMDAWRAAATDTVGYPPVTVADVESGKVVPARTIFEP